MFAVAGIWAADSDEDEQRPAFGSRHKLGQDLTGGISFISGGFKKSTGADAKDVGVEEEVSRALVCQCDVCCRLWS